MSEQITFGHEVYLESVIVGLDEKDVVYVRTSGLHGKVQVIRIKPSDLEPLGRHLLSRLIMPKQGANVKLKPQLPPEEMAALLASTPEEPEETSTVTPVITRVRIRELTPVGAPSPVQERVRRRD